MKRGIFNEDRAEEERDYPRDVLDEDSDDSVGHDVPVGQGCLGFQCTPVWVWNVLSCLPAVSVRSGINQE